MWRNDKGWIPQNYVLKVNASGEKQDSWVLETEPRAWCMLDGTLLLNYTPSLYGLDIQFLLLLLTEMSWSLNADQVKA